MNAIVRKVAQIEPETVTQSKSYCQIRIIEIANQLNYIR